MESLNLFDDKFRLILNGGVHQVKLLEKVQEEKHQDPSKIVADVAPIPSKNIGGKSSCSYCQIEFEDVNAQREHYKLDWHRYNLKQSLLSKQPITEQEFDTKTIEDDVSSISGSDSDSDTPGVALTAQGKILLQNSTSGQLFSLYTALIGAQNDDKSLIDALEECSNPSKKWTILMLGGGHFAGAIFERNDAILHKTFHCYTVRAGQGGSQSARDNRSGSGHPKSAGASLRRHSEQALAQHVRSILEQWKGHIDQSSLIVYRAAGSYNRAVLFGGGGAPLLVRGDGRLRTIPFSTRRATFAEVRRVHGVLTQVQLYQTMEAAALQFETNSHSSRNKKRATSIDRAKSRDSPDRPLPQMPIIQESDSSDNCEENMDILSHDETLQLDDSLQEFGDSLTPEQRRQPSRKRPKRISKTKKLKERDERRKRDLVKILIHGHLDQFEQFLLDNEEPTKVDDVIDEDGNTALHVAAMNEHVSIVTFLLDRGASPCLKNEKQQTVYTCTQSRDIRECLRQFARENPDKYNYNKAHIPTNCANPEEVAARKKAQRKVKKEKEKIKKKENDVKKMEQAEAERFLKLSDREKRALAAERRILNQSGQVTARCFLCGTDISGKVPFEYNSNRFCSVDCLKAHRMQNMTLS